MQWVRPRLVAAAGLTAAAVLVFAYTANPPATAAGPVTVQLVPTPTPTGTP
jgi:hypothetical protein